MSEAFVSELKRVREKSHHLKHNSIQIQKSSTQPSQVHCNCITLDHSDRLKGLYRACINDTPKTLHL